MKKLMSTMLAAAIVLVPASYSVKADEAYKELSPEVKKSLMTKIGNEENIPPEILKAIAFKETGMNQFENGKPHISSDGGIGIMQVTPSSLSASEKTKLGLDAAHEAMLGSDTEYNIRIGAEILKMKWNLSTASLPRINSHDPKYLEHWYFAIMAYNGFSERNNPGTHSATYQTDVYNTIKHYALQNLYSFPVPALKSDGNGVLKFQNPQENWGYANTASMMMLKPGDQVITRVESNLRESVAPNAKAVKIPVNTIVQITGAPVESSDIKNLFSYYPVKVDGKAGFMATTNLKELTLSVPYPEQKQVLPYGSVTMKENVQVYGKVNGAFKAISKTYPKDLHKDVIGIENGYYQTGSNEYVLHNPDKLYYVTGRLYVKSDIPTRKLSVTEDMDANYNLKSRANFKVFGIDQKYYYLGTINGAFHTVPKTVHASYMIGLVQPKKNGVPQYFPNSTKVAKYRNKNELLKVAKYDEVRGVYDVGAGYYMKKEDVTFLTY